MTAGMTLLRIVVGLLFVGHGLQKLRGWFGGGGPDGTAGMMESLDMRPGRANAIAAGVAETAGGAAIVLGAATPAAAASLIATMITAVRKVHWSNGVWNHAGGYEYNAVLTAAVVAIAADGPGRFSIDALFGKARWGAAAAAAAIVAGGVGSTLIIEAGRRAAPSGAAPVADDAEPAHVEDVEEDPTS